MEQPQNKKIVPIIIILVLIVSYSYFMVIRGDKPDQPSKPSVTRAEAVVTVENTIMIHGVLSAPKEFPEDIPLEKEMILESATTNYPNKNTRQLSVAYKSSGTIMQKYLDYRNYMSQAGYNVIIEEKDENSLARTVFGSKKNTNLSVVLSSLESGTLVELSYLIFLN